MLLTDKDRHRRTRYIVLKTRKCVRNDARMGAMPYYEN